MQSALPLLALSAIISALALSRLYSRLQLSRSKHASLRGHAKWSRRMARMVSYYEFDHDAFFSTDGAPVDVAGRRRAGLHRLRRELRRTCPQGLAYNSDLVGSISDVSFTSNYRVPFPFRAALPEEFKVGTIAVASEGARIQDLDGNWRYDCSGSYGVNVFGYDFYKQCISEGMQRAQRLGPVLGPYHPVIREVVDKLRDISRLDEVSFHMSGTEAVMQAVRLARYHTGRTHLVRFCGAYHGWWDGVQPGVGNLRKVNDVYTLEDMSEQTLRVIGSRKDIACVLVNPLQGLHPNADAPGDATLVSGRAQMHFDRDAYTAWLQRLRDVCNKKGVVLIFDEVLTGFRLDYRGAMGYFGVQGDMVTYGKTLGGGLPVGVLCGRADLMKRYRDEQPANISFARGTFNSHPYVLASMLAFLQRAEGPECQAIYAAADDTWNRRVEELNRRLAAEELPVRLANLHSVLTVGFTNAGRYHWMFQFYLRGQGLELSWTGSGRMIMSLAYRDSDFEEVMRRFVNAAREMAADGWWWTCEELTAGKLRRQLAREMLQAKLAGRPKPFAGNDRDDKETTMARAGKAR